MQHISSKLIHGNIENKITDSHKCLKTPIYQAASFDFDNSSDMEKAFRGENDSFTYSRISNPTVTELQNRLNVLSSAQNTLCVSSGMAAISNVFFTICEKGDNIITSNFLFGNTYSFFTSTLAPFGVETRFVKFDSIDELEQKVDKNTRAIFIEIPTNPQLIIYDIEKIADWAFEKGILVITDNSILTPYIFEANKYKIDIEVFSNTKFISGGATSIGGSIQIYETHKWKNIPKFKKEYESFGTNAFYKRLYNEIYRNIGACLSPQSAWLQLLGLETLSLRVDRVNENTLKVAEFLSNHKSIAKIEYPSLKSSKQYDLSQKYMPKGSGCLINLNLKNKENCFKFMDSLQMIKKGTNFCDNKSMVIHPSSTIYWSLEQKHKEEMEIDDGMIRLSVGIEHINDIIGDLEKALKEL